MNKVLPIDEVLIETLTVSEMSLDVRRYIDPQLP